MSRKDRSIGTKTFYTPTEAAIRWSGLQRQERQIIDQLDPTRQPRPSDFHQSSRLRLNIARIFDGLANGDLPYGEHGVTLGHPFLLHSPHLTIRHLDLKKWMRQHYPEEKPAFLFGADTKNPRPLVDPDTVRALLTEKELLKAQLDARTTALQQLQTQFAALQKQHATAGEDASMHPRAESTYLSIIGAMVHLMLGHSPAGQPYSQFNSQDAIIDALLVHNDGQPGISQRTLAGKFAAARRQLQSGRA